VQPHNYFTEGWGSVIRRNLCGDDIAVSQVQTHIMPAQRDPKILNIWPDACSLCSLRNDNAPTALDWPVLLFWGAVWREKRSGDCNRTAKYLSYSHTGLVLGVHTWRNCVLEAP
jgi:hypothetical protein